MRTLRTPVLVVGAGPAGLVTALVLAQHGVRSIVVERHPGTSIYPRATGISLRSMEILRSLGVEDDVRAFSLDARPLMHVSPTLTAPGGQVVPLGFPDPQQAAAVSPTGPVISPQDHVEPVLVRRLHQLGRTDLRFSTELVSLDVRGDRAVAVVRDLETGVETRIEPEWVVGADGTRSTVRTILGIEPVGPTGLEHHASILFRAPLWSHLGERRFGLYGVGGPGVVPGVFVPMGPDDRWVFAAMGPRELVDGLVAEHPRAVAAIRAGTGVPDLEVQVLSAMPLEFAAQLAPVWRVGPVFLAGDAAHRMPPIGGRGMNTAIADAANLGWKLAYVVSGYAAPALLESYEAERMPVARRNVSLALSRYEEQAAAAGLALDLPATGPREGTPDGLLEDLGYAYRSGAILDDTDADAGTIAGTRVPHAWLRAGSGTVSTVDLATGELVLLTAGAGVMWRRAADGLRGPGPIARGFAALGPAMTPVATPPLVVIALGEDVADDDGSAVRDLGLAPGGALLVRPDGHVAARWISAPADARAALGQGLASVTGAVAVPTRDAATQQPDASERAGTSMGRVPAVA